MLLYVWLIGKVFIKLFPILKIHDEHRAFHPAFIIKQTTCTDDMFPYSFFDCLTGENVICCSFFICNSLQKTILTKINAVLFGHITDNDYLCTLYVM